MGNMHLDPEHEARRDRYDSRFRQHDERLRLKKSTEQMAHQNRVILQRKVNQENAFDMAYGDSHQHGEDRSLSAMYNDPVNVVSGLRDRIKQKPHMFVSMFPPKVSYR